VGKSAPAHNDHARKQAKSNSGGAVSSGFMAYDRKGPLSDQKAEVPSIDYGIAVFLICPSALTSTQYQLDTPARICGVSPVPAIGSKVHRIGATVPIACCRRMHSPSSI